MKRLQIPHLDRGFTLLELLVVMVIIGLLAGFVAPRYFAQVGKSQVKAARAQIDALDKALDQYRIDVGHLPTSEQGLVALNTQPQGEQNWAGPYLKKEVRSTPGAAPTFTSSRARITTISTSCPMARMAARAAPAKPLTWGTGKPCASVSKP